jgi:hypothetical protein
MAPMGWVSRKPAPPGDGQHGADLRRPEVVGVDEVYDEGHVEAAITQGGDQLRPHEGFGWPPVWHWYRAGRDGITRNSGHRPGRV